MKANDPNFVTKACTKCGLFKGRDAFFKSKRNIDGHQGACKVCMTAVAKIWQQANRDRVNAATKKWREANPDKNALKSRRWRRKFPERHQESNERYRKAYPEKHAAKFAKRRAARLRATPFWADRRAIVAVYAEAARVSSETGVKHHVDHIVPLVSPLVCGLHAEANLQVLDNMTNRKKHNLVWPDMP